MEPTVKQLINMEDDKSITQLFSAFIEAFNLHYQKIDKEISYKCYQATWIISTNKATGYGRTQSQAYKHALRNLIQILLDQIEYKQFFVQYLSNKANNKAKLVKTQLKTQTNQTTSTSKKVKLKASLSKKSITKNKQYSIQYPKTVKPQIMYSKINLNTSSQADIQLKMAKQKLIHLNKILQEINKENQSLKQEIQQSQKYMLKKQSEEDMAKKLKIDIPKLKLQILPNYHKKSEKSLNQYLLAVYNQRHHIKINN